jgi:GT2 family glycosyltransferase
MIDLIITTCGRVDLLKRTLRYIWNRTKTPYKIIVIDDASSDGTRGYLNNLLNQDKVSKVIFNDVRLGIPANMRTFDKVTSSDPIVFSDDDVLCPKLEPDWLSQGLSVMKKFPKIGLLSLNDPQCNVGDKRGRLKRYDRFTFCRNIPGHFVFVRREVLNKIKVADRETSPVKAMCFKAPSIGYKVAYLNNVWCQHIGVVSVRNKKDLGKELSLVNPINLGTLEPPDKYRG